MRKIMNRRLKSMILDIIETYSPIIGGVPLQMLEYHLKHHPHNNGEKYTKEEIREELTNLLHEKQITRDVIAYKTGKIE